MKALASATDFFPPFSHCLFVFYLIPKPWLLIVVVRVVSRCLAFLLLSLCAGVVRKRPLYGERVSSHSPRIGQASLGDGLEAHVGSGAWWRRGVSLFPIF